MKKKVKADSFKINPDRLKEVEIFDPFEKSKKQKNLSKGYVVLFDGETSKHYFFLQATTVKSLKDCNNSMFIAERSEYRSNKSILTAAIYSAKKAKQAVAVLERFRIKGGKKPEYSWNQSFPKSAAHMKVYAVPFKDFFKPRLMVGSPMDYIGEYKERGLPFKKKFVTINDDEGVTERRAAIDKALADIEQEIKEEKESFKEACDEFDETKQAHLEKLKELSALSNKLQPSSVKVIMDLAREDSK